MRVCSNCSNPLNENQIFCPKCGTHNPVVDAEQEAREELDNYFSEDTSEDNLDRGIDSEEVLSGSTSSDGSISEFSLQENAPVITDEDSDDDLEVETADEEEFVNTFGQDEETAEIDDEDRFTNTFDNENLNVSQDGFVQSDEEPDTQTETEVEQAEQLENLSERNSNAANDNTFSFGVGAGTPPVNPTQTQQNYRTDQNTNYAQNTWSNTRGQAHGYGQTGQTYYNNQNQYQGGNQYARQGYSASQTAVQSKEDLEFAQTGLPEKYKPIPFWEYLIYALVAMIPIGTIIVFIYSIFLAVQNDNVHRKNWGIGRLILIGIGFVLAIIALIIVFTIGAYILQSFVWGPGGFQ